MCPACRTVMLIVEFQGVQLDHCPKCRGTWFDIGELEFVCERANLTRETVQAALGPVSTDGAEDRRCPRCRSKLVVIRSAGTPTLALERCPNGDGVWFDRGELATFIARLSGTAAASLAEFLGDVFKCELTGSQEDGAA